MNLLFFLHVDWKDPSLKNCQNGEVQNGLIFFQNGQEKGIVCSDMYLDNFDSKTDSGLYGSFCARNTNNYSFHLQGKVDRARLRVHYLQATEYSESFSSNVEVTVGPFCNPSFTIGESEAFLAYSE